MIFKIAHFGFGTTEIKVPINWRMDPYKNKNWRHNLMSLRWLDSRVPVKEMQELLLDFYNYHIKKNISNPYYNSLRGDHTAAIRLEQLVRLFLVYSKYQHVPLNGMFIRLIRQDIVNLQSDQMYRNGHNHGLMCDIALLFTYYNLSELRKFININFIVERSYATYLSLFYETGLTRENSISYQEYNLGVVFDYINILSLINPELSFCVNDIFDESRKVLGLSLGKDGKYLPLGDSLYEPKPHILNKVYNEGINRDVFETLMPYSHSDYSGYYFNQGLVLYKDKKGVHFGQTIMHGSNSHKQNDELSFCFTLSGKKFIVDPGYSALPEEDMQAFIRSEHAHSTLQILGERYTGLSDKSDFLVEASFFSYLNNELKYQFVNNRYNNCSIINNVSISPEILSLDYKVEPIDNNGLISFQEKILSLVLDPDVFLEKVDEKNYLLKNGTILVKLGLDCNVDCNISVLNSYVLNSKQEIVETKKINFNFTGNHIRIVMSYAN